MSLYLSLLVSLLLTLALELGLLLLCSRKRPGLRARRELALAALVNLLTNPPVVLITLTVRACFPAYLLPAVLLLELAAVLTEWLCYRACSQAIHRPLLFSLCANLFSFLCGVGLALLRALLR